LTDNPDFLLENCNISSWLSLIGFKPPASTISYLNQLSQQENRNWDIQAIEDASGTVINLDYFAVKINRLPNNANGVQMTPAEFFDELSANFMNLIDKENADFQFYSPQDQQRWYSQDPINTVFTIVIPGDDGSVVASDFKTSDYYGGNWIFSTLKAPFVEDGYHPVSGNRQFGLKRNRDGTFEVYTRGADRVTNFYHKWFQSAAFDGADKTWRSFQAGVMNYVNQRGGDAGTPSDLIEEIKRPNWNSVHEAIKTGYYQNINCND
ncbi:MAG TPA: hypothetical protein VJ951_02110, partial [Bacteroidales bacterium]|nr:hypothetical protein [Bacteroidales bacterium]